MYVSRSEARNNDKRRKQRRFRRLLIINIVMLLLIGGFVWGITATGGFGKLIDGFLTQEGKPGGGPSGGGERANGSANGAEDREESGLDADNPDTEADEPEVSEPIVVEEPAAEPEPEGPVRLAFVGDILLASSVEALIRKHGMDYPYAKALPFLLEPDLTAGNLENPITTRGVPAENKSYVFKGSPDLLEGLREAGFDVVSLANNHTLDQGLDGLYDTMKHVSEAGIAHMGAGENDVEAFRPAVLEAKGMRVAYFGLTHVVPVPEWKAERHRAGLAETYDTTRALAAIKEARESGDIDIIAVMVHWGKERDEKPQPYQRNYARAYIDAGADLIIGAHPHVLQGFEEYNGGWIAYSLGNFIFNVTQTPRTKDTGVLEAVCTKERECKLQFHPMRAELSQPAPLEGEKASALLEYIQSISFGVEIDKEGFLSPAARQ